MTDLADGESVEVKGSAAKPYLVKNTGGVYSCSCPAWRNQSTPIERRTCKHIRRIRGDEAEKARVGSALPAPKTESTKGPPILLAQAWDSATDLTDWWMSEKLDGVPGLLGRGALPLPEGKHVSRSGVVHGGPTVGDPRRRALDRPQGLPAHDQRRPPPGQGGAVAGGPLRDLRRPRHRGPLRDPPGGAPRPPRGHRAPLRPIARPGPVRGPRPSPGGARPDRGPRGRGAHGPGAGLPVRGRPVVDPPQGEELPRCRGRGRRPPGRPGQVQGHARGARDDDGGRDRVPDRHRLHRRRATGPAPGGERRDLPLPGALGRRVPRFPSFVAVRERAAGEAAVAAPSPEATPDPAPEPGSGRRFELVSGKSSKFWEVSVDGTDVTTRYGRIGTGGQSKTKSFADADAARATPSSWWARRRGRATRSADPSMEIRPPGSGRSRRSGPTISGSLIDARGPEEGHSQGRRGGGPDPRRRFQDAEIDGRLPLHRRGGLQLDHGIARGPDRLRVRGTSAAGAIRTLGVIVRSCFEEAELDGRFFNLSGCPRPW